MRALIFDLDGTLVDSAYQHALAWQEALRSENLDVPAAEVHRLIGMSGSLLAATLAGEQDRTLSKAQLKSLEKLHGTIFSRYSAGCRPLPGAIALLKTLAAARTPHGIATSGKAEDVAASLKSLRLSRRTRVIDGGQVKNAKPDPDLFLACQQSLEVPAKDCAVIGDSVWDIHAARRAGMSAVGVLTGGFSEQELHNAGAILVYPDLVSLTRRVTQLGLEIK